MSVVQPQQTALPEEQPPPPTMDEPPPPVIAIDNPVSESTPTTELAIRVAQIPQGDSESAESTPEATAEASTANTPAESQEAPEPASEEISSNVPPQEQAAAAETESSSPPTDPDPPPPPPPQGDERETDVPEWVTYEEDKSEITEEELKKLEESDGEVSALDVLLHEKKIYREVDDPEQRPVKKLRLSWTIKGVRGTKERPNYARVMNSPAAYVDGFYWYIKFFPRGNNCSNISSYIKCTPRKPRPDSSVPENTFKVFEGPPDANLGEVEPVVELSIPATPAKERDTKATVNLEDDVRDSKKPSGDVLPDSTIASADGSEKTEVTPTISEPETDWRISAQLGTVIYNPAEPRTGCYMNSEHQFNKHNDDWGWTNFPIRWSEMHVRQSHQRKPLLQDDSLTIDAYIQIFEDPTQALWWHQSHETEKQWDSKSLTGYFPFGTPPLFHSPGVAGLSALLLLKPFREILQGVDAGKWRKDARVKPQPLISQLQIVLFLMRTMKKDELYVNLNPVLETLDSYSESFPSVRQFWEILRRSIEIELEADPEASRKLADIFDGARSAGYEQVTLAEPIQIVVEGVEDIQEGIEKSLVTEAGGQSFPKLLTVDLDRQKFDKTSREWKMLHNRVKLNEELDLSKFSPENAPSRYTLYGFSVHVGDRPSGKSYSVLRPNGPGTKWLAFEDGEGNKVFSYTKKRIQDFEGLEGEALSSFRATRQTANIAMYIRTDCLKDFLPGSLEPYDEPSFDWIRSHHANPIGCVFNGDVKPKRPDVEKPLVKEISVEVYNGARVKGRKGLLDMYNLRDPSQPFQKFTLPATTTFKELRRRIAGTMWIENVESIRFWQMEYGALGEFSVATMPTPKLEYAIAGRRNKEYKPLCLWLEVLETAEDIKLYGIPDPPEPEKPNPDQHNILGDHVNIQETSNSDAPTENDPVLSSLFPESQEGSSDDNTPTGTISTPSSGGTEDRSINVTAPPDEVQDSVTEAGIATMASVPDLPAQVADSTTNDLSDLRNRPELEPSDLDSPLTTTDMPEWDRTVPTGGDATPRAVPVEHGQLIDAATAEPRQVTAEPVISGEQTTGNNPAIDDETADIIASIIATEVAAADIADQTPSTDEPIPAPAETLIEPTVDDTESPGETNTGDTIPSPPVEEEPPAPEPRPIKHIYGFIQLFDVWAQDFVIHSTFFAPVTADVKETVRKAIGYCAEHALSVWQRERSCNTSSVGANTTFESIRFRDGVDVIVSEPLSEKTKASLLAEGKFVTPDTLSRYLWMKARKHPIESFTGIKTVNTFGRDYYSGPLLNGRFHGEDATYITSSGHVYVGPFVAGVRQGANGTLTYQNGDTYLGSFQNNEKHGQGTFIQKRTGNKYVGGHQNDKRWGKGTMYYEVADEEGEMCQICYGEAMDALFYDCGHVCACVECARQVEVCPICRKSVREVVRVYRA